jgi:DtxR family Mn-dependent transcriptional regulator
MLSGKRSQSHELTASHEHYLRSIWAVRLRRGYARLGDVARELGVTPPTLSVGLRALEARGLVAHDDRRFLVLSARGERLARQVHHRFALTCAFLRDVLGVPEQQALADACLIEHDLSEVATERLLDLIRLLRDDVELRASFQRRFAEYHRSCAPGDDCATCGLSCVAEAPPSR